ncbi:HlyD family secretion protein [uncultured Sphingomonas sp.]|uniref:HlyD family secretion protein n=1 Tax=uncultured Sphingomonas sp. TaxID=158754 RepID=UPI0025E206AB|nr:HlyD family secretion protein [uncultured Sphingomonas sp.]
MAEKTSDETPRRDKGDAAQGDDTRKSKGSAKQDGQDDDDGAHDGSGDGSGRQDGKGGDEKGGDEDKRDQGPPLYKRPIFWIVAGGIALVLLVGGLLWWLHARNYESTDDAFIDAHIVRIAAETSGRLTQVAEVDNRHVPHGKLLAVIEPGANEATQEEAQAGIAQADAQIRQAEAQVISARASRRQAVANAQVPLAEAARAARDYARYVDLRARDPLAAAATQLDQARAQAESASAQAAAAQRQVGTADASILAARRQVDAARAQRGAAVARLRQASVTVSYLRIRAPVDGQLVNRQVNVGSYVAPGQQLMAIVPDRVWITANFKETQLALMRPGQPVRIKVDAFPGVDFAGHVDSIQRGAGQAFQLLPPQNATGNYVKVVQRVPVRILFDDDKWRKYAIGPGMSVVPRVKIR